MSWSWLSYKCEAEAFPEPPSVADMAFACRICRVWKPPLCEDSASQALQEWVREEGWPAHWTRKRACAWTGGVSLFTETCQAWPWLALAMMDAGLQARESEYNGVAALCAAIRGAACDLRVVLIRRLIAEGVDVNGLGGPNVNRQGVSPLACCLGHNSAEEGAQQLQALLGSPELALHVQCWEWLSPSTTYSAIKYARDRCAQWAEPMLRQAQAMADMSPTRVAWMTAVARRARRRPNCMTASCAGL